MKLLIFFLVMLMSMTLVSGSYYSFDDEVSWWEFDSPASNSTFALDSAGDNNGTVTGALNGSSAYYDEGYNIDGVNNKIEIPESSDFHVEASGSTWSIWFKNNGPGIHDNQGLMENGGVSDGIEGIRMLLRGYPAMIPNVYVSNFTTRNIGSYGGIITSGNWYNWVVTYTYDGDWIIYINGVEIGSPHTMPTGPINSTYDLKLGASVLANRAFNGSIDDARIFNYTLSSSEIKELYSCRTPNDGTGIWTVLANCTVSNESDTINETLIVTAGRYTADNTTIKASTTIASGGMLIATNGGRIIAGG